MSELTKEHFDQQISHLATKADLQDVIETQRTHTDTLESHTTELDGIAKNTEKSNTEFAGIKATLERYKRWFIQIAEKIQIRLE